MIFSWVATSLGSPGIKVRTVRDIFGTSFPLIEAPKHHMVGGAYADLLLNENQYCSLRSRLPTIICIT